MFQFILNFFILMSSMVFVQVKHPLSMGLMLLIQTFLISLLIGLMGKTFWFSYILFLVFLGGMLVMFIYVTSLSSNEILSISSNLFVVAMVALLFSSFIIILFLDLTYINNIFNLEIEQFNNLNSLLIKENSINLLKLYNYSTNLISLFLINYLFLTLIIVVKITNFFYGPLRPSFN